MSTVVETKCKQKQVIVVGILDVLKWRDLESFVCKLSMDKFH